MPIYSGNKKIDSLYFNGKKIASAFFGSKQVYSASSGRLPKEYQEVEYLESSGSQWINTNVNIQSGDEVYTKSSTKETGNYKTVYGMNTKNNSFEVYYNIPSFDVYTYGFSANLISGPTTGLSINIAYEHIVKFNDEANNINIFTYNENGSYLLNGRVYYLKVKRNENYIYDLIPCYRKADNKPGLYDLVNDVFYTNAGTGEFEVGGNV